MKFGEYLRSVRKKNNYTIKRLSKELSISASYLSSLENGQRASPSYEILQKASDVLELSASERFKLYDLAAESRQPPTVSRDLAEYIIKTPKTRSVLRLCEECGLTDKDWDNIITYIRGYCIKS